MKSGDWRVFVLDHREAIAKMCHEVTRVHLMAEPFGVSFGFVEQRVQRHTLKTDAVQFFVFCSAANLGTDGKRVGQPVPSLREGMDILEWLWNERKGKETP